MTGQAGQETWHADKELETLDSLNLQSKETHHMKGEKKLNSMSFVFKVCHQCRM